MRGAAGLVWLGCLLVVVAACTSPRPGPTQPSPTTWDPTAWRPPSSVAVPTMSEAEMATRRLAELQTMADIWGIKPARTLPLERWTLPDDHPQRLPLIHAFGEQLNCIPVAVTFEPSRVT